jgi:vancomycin resistance protein YoaR
MTTVPGHNIVIQQSGAAQELSNQAQASKPSPEQAAAQQEASELQKNTTVQEFDESERTKTKKEKEKEKRQEQELAERRKKQQKEDKELDPDATGKLLDTTA